MCMCYVSHRYLRKEEKVSLLYIQHTAKMMPNGELEIKFEKHATVGTVVQNSTDSCSLFSSLSG